MKTIIFYSIVFTILLCIGCKKEEGELTNFSTLELNFGETKEVTFHGIPYKITFTDLEEERCANCQNCYKPNGIYANVILQINDSRHTLRMRTCTLDEETTWNQAQSDRNVFTISSNLKAAALKLVPKDSQLKKSEYRTKIVFNY